MADGTVFYIGEIVANTKDKLSGVIIRPGVNGNGYFYSRENVAQFIAQLPNVPLVKNHSLDVGDNIGGFKSGEISQDGSGIGHFYVSQAEKPILDKILDNTIRYFSVAHTYGTRTYCNICNKDWGKCEHNAYKTYDDVKCGEGFENPQLLHVSVVQNPADLGCQVIANSWAVKVTNLTDELGKLRLAYADQAGLLKQAQTEVERLKRMKSPEPPSEIPVTQTGKEAKTLLQELIEKHGG